MDLGVLGKEIIRAAEEGRDHVRRTPVEKNTVPTGGSSVTCILKLENLQHTGSFKFRGALNRLLRLSASEKEAGVVAASTGNHGAAVARAASQLGLEATIFVPAETSTAKLEKIRQYGAGVVVHGDDCVESEMYARAIAASKGGTFVSPYNDPLVIAGQGTVGLELVEQAGHLDAIFLSLGGGGLASGIAAAVHDQVQRPEIVGCSPANSPVMYESIRAGHIVEWPVQSTLSDGTAGGIEPGAITFDLCKRLVDRHVLISEEEIRAEMIRFIGEHHQLAEGAAGVALAGFRRLKSEYAGKRVAVVVCGGNLGLETLKRILAEDV